MLKLIKLSLASATLAMAAMFAACTNNEPAADLIAEADSLVDNADYSSAQDICNRLLKSDNQLSAAQYGRMSLIFLKIAEADETTDPTDNMVSATTCYVKAFETNPDSAMAFYSSVDADERGMANGLHFLANPGALPEIPDTLETDSLFFN